MRAIIQFNGTDWINVAWLAKDKINMLLNYSGTAGAVIVRHKK
jgi:hypothetical protein